MWPLLILCVYWEWLQTADLYFDPYFAGFQTNLSKSIMHGVPCIVWTEFLNQGGHSNLTAYDCPKLINFNLLKSVGHFHHKICKIPSSRNMCKLNIEKARFSPKMSSNRPIFDILWQKWWKFEILYWKLVIFYHIFTKNGQKCPRMAIFWYFFTQKLNFWG